MMQPIITGTITNIEEDTIYLDCPIKNVSVPASISGVDCKKYKIGQRVIVYTEKLKTNNKLKGAISRNEGELI